MSNVPTETEPELAFESEIEESGRPLHEYVAMLASKLGLLWANRGWILRATFIAMVVTVGVAFLLPNQYTATVYLNPPDSNPISGINLLIGMKTGAANLTSQVGDVLGLKSPGQLYIRELQTRTVEDHLIDRFNLQKVYRTRWRYQTRRALEDNTEFDEDRKSGVIKVSVTDTDAKRAAQIANAYAEELGQLLAGINSTAGQREREYFEAQLMEAQNKLQQAQQQLGEFGSKSGAMDVTDEGRAVFEKAATIEGQLIASQSELQGMLQIYTDKHERVQQVRAKIAELNRQLLQVKGKSPSPNSGANAAAPGDNVGSTVKNVWGMAAPYMEHYRRVKVQEAVVDTLTQQYQISRLQEAYRVSDVQVIDPADVPERKSAPHRATMGAFAGMLVFIFCCGYVLLDDWWTRTDEDNPWKRVLSPAADRLIAVKHRAKARFGWSRFPWRRKAAISPAEGRPSVD